jgi:hypothetical protein
MFLSPLVPYVYSLPKDLEVFFVGHILNLLDPQFLGLSRQEVGKRGLSGANDLRV